MRTLRYLLPHAVLPCLLLAWTLSTGTTLAYDDLRVWFYPYKLVQYQHGFTLWNPWDLSGMPMLADMQRSLLYPPNLLFSLLPTAVAMPFFVAVHFFLAGAFTSLFLQRVGLTPAAATVGGLIYANSSSVVLHSSQLPYFAALAWLPLVLWAWEGNVRQPGARAAGLAALALACFLLCGSPPVMYIGAWVMAGYVAWRRGTAFRGRPLQGREVLWLLCPAVLALGLAAPQLWPTAELLQFTPRSRATLEFVSFESIPWDHWVLLFVPFLYRNVPHVGLSDFHEVTVFVGRLPLVLAFLGAWKSRSDGGLARFWVGAGLLGLGLSLGTNFFLHPLCFKLLPGYSLLRNPGRWSLLFTLGVSYLAACGVEALPEAVRRPRFVGFVATFVAVGWLAAAFAPTGGFEFIAFWTAGGILLATASRWLDRVSSWPVVGLVLWELLAFAFQYLSVMPVGTVDPAPALLSKLTPKAGQGRVLTNQDNRSPPLLGHWASAHDLSDVQGSTPLLLDYYLEYVVASASGHLPAGPELTDLLNHDGFTLLPARPANPMLAMLNVQTALSYERGNPAVERVPGSPGAAWAVRGARIVPDRHEIVLGLARRLLDPTQEVFLEGAPPGMPVQSGQGFLAAGIAVTRSRADAITYLVDMPEDGYLVMSEVYYPGWRAAVDGVPTPLARADGLLRCLHLARGSHEVAVDFEPESWRWGCIICIASLVIVAILVGIRKGITTPGGNPSAPCEPCD